MFCDDFGDCVVGYVGLVGNCVVGSVEYYVELCVCLGVYVGGGFLFVIFGFG